MNTTLIQRNLWKKLQSKKYRHSFVSSQIGAGVAAQIASTRVAQGLTQKELAMRANMSQVRISVLEDPSYENFSIKTLRRIAEALDVALIVKFAPFTEMLGWLSRLRPENLAVSEFEKDVLQLDQTPADESLDKFFYRTNMNKPTLNAANAATGGVKNPPFNHWPHSNQPQQHFAAQGGV